MKWTGLETRNCRIRHKINFVDNFFWYVEIQWDKRKNIWKKKKKVVGRRKMKKVVAYFICGLILCYLYTYLAQKREKNSIRKQSLQKKKKKSFISKSNLRLWALNGRICQEEGLKNEGGQC